jgi:hypothetical protein
MKQKLLFPVPRNFHLVYLNGRPVGAWSLYRFCILHVIYYQEGLKVIYRYEDGSTEVVKRTITQAAKEKYKIQRELMNNYKNGLIKQKPFWLKQREYWKKFLRAYHNGESLEVYYANK